MVELLKATCCCSHSECKTAHIKFTDALKDTHTKSFHQGHKNIGQYELYIVRDLIIKLQHSLKFYSGIQLTFFVLKSIILESLCVINYLLRFSELC